MMCCNCIHKNVCEKYVGDDNVMASCEDYLDELNGFRESSGKVSLRDSVTHRPIEFARYARKKRGKGELEFYYDFNHISDTWLVFIKLAKFVNSEILYSNDRRIKSRDYRCRTLEDIPIERWKDTVEMLEKISDIYNDYYMKFHPLEKFEKESKG